ncbi:uncharacterized protein LOC115980776 [Quercus lobata]|uniref:uncharacterized protein LOC115980776 n=1 Tax=Quercus lobata TaxID=97700 RepID=UPI00124822E3|nr:uncharacterized protein LOC115980776 [Quercus lobata]
MEALSRMLVTATAAGQFSGFIVGNVTGSLMTMSHLLFADDTIVFSDADSNHIIALRGILSRFEEMSGLKINLGKSKLVAVGDVPNLHELVEILGCRESALPLKYLGLPLGASFKDKMIWNPILEKMERRLAGWKRIIGARYGNEWGGWCTKSVSEAYGVCLWKFIRSGWGNFSKFIRYEVGDGTRVKFWDDVWYRDRPLKEAFLDLYNISKTRDASVSEVMCFVNGRVSWDIQFHRLVNDQESQSLDSFMVLIYSTKVRGVGSDNLCWKPASSRGFKNFDFTSQRLVLLANYTPG